MLVDLFSNIDPLTVRIFLVGIGIALISGPLGCFVIWRRMAFFGDTMAHSALLGLSMSYVLELNAIMGVFFSSLLIALLLLILQKSKLLSVDTLLGVLSHGALAGGLLATYLFLSLTYDLETVLLGNITFVSWQDTIIVNSITVVVLLILVFMWRNLITTTVNYEIAATDKKKPAITQLVFIILLALVVSVAIKIIGVLLITALLVIPAAAARFISKSPEIMVIVATIISVSGVVIGIIFSFSITAPTGPSIVMSSLIIFLILGFIRYAVSSYINWRLYQNSIKNI